MPMTSADRRKALGVIEDHGGTEADPERGKRLAAGLEALLESDPLVESIEGLRDSVTALREQISKDNSGVRSELLSELRSQRWQNAMLQTITLGIVAALVGIGMSYRAGGMAIDITPAGGQVTLPDLEPTSDGNDDAAWSPDTVDTSHPGPPVPTL